MCKRQPGILLEPQLQIYRCPDHDELTQTAERARKKSLVVEKDAAKVLAEVRKLNTDFHSAVAELGRELAETSALIVAIHRKLFANGVVIPVGGK